MRSQTRKTRLAQVAALRGPIAPNYSRAEIEEMPGEWLGFNTVDKGGQIRQQSSVELGRKVKPTKEQRQSDRAKRVEALAAAYASGIDPFPNVDIADRLVATLANMGKRGFSTTRLLKDDRSGSSYE